MPSNARGMINDYTKSNEYLINPNQIYRRPDKNSPNKTVMINVKKFITKSNILKLRLARNKTELTTLNGDKIKMS